MIGETISAEEVGTILAALTALSTAAFGLLDATKAFSGGVSNIGSSVLRKALTPFEPALAAALGAGNWWPLVRDNWVSGVAKADQKARVQSLIKLGLTGETARAIAGSCHVDADILESAANKYATGLDLSDQEIAAVGRASAVIDAVMDSAFERASQVYQNWCRVLAGAISVGLSLLASRFLVPETSTQVALAVGLLAVPIAPLAKDLTSALSAAMNALKATRKV